MGHPCLSVGESILLIHAQRTVIYDVVIVSKNLERTNENDGFKMTALENSINVFNVFIIWPPNGDKILNAVLHIFTHHNAHCYIKSN